MREPIVELRGVTKAFGKKVILNNVDLKVYEGEAIGVESIDFDPFRRPGEPVPASPATGATAAVDPPQPTSRLPASLSDAVAALEVDALRGALRATRHHQRKAATLLGLSYHQFRGLYRKHARAVAGE